MTRLLLPLLLLVGCRAHSAPLPPAGPESATSPAEDLSREGASQEADAQPAADDEAFEKPLEEPEEGSLWAFIEEAMEGQPPTEEELAASRELDEEQTSQQDYQEEPSEPPADDPLLLQAVDPSEFDLPVVLNDKVKSWMNYYLHNKTGRKFFENSLSRGARFKPLISSELRKRGMPQDLYYLAMIESGFKTNAYSRASAVGLWQFISSTGRAEGLRIDWWIDERRDPELATYAALQHLQGLYDQFDDWYLAAAGYNAGAGGVRGAMRRTGGKDYWAVAKPGGLPKETRNYVPMLIAAAIIGHDPERYGFADVQLQPELAYDTVAVPNSTSIKSLARCASMSEKEFQALNPGLRRWAVPADSDTYPVHVPFDMGADFIACVKTIPASERVAFAVHRVRRGETLSAIARRYGVSLSEVVRMNKIRNANHIKVGMELVIPVPGSSGVKGKAAEPRLLGQLGPGVERDGALLAETEEEQAAQEPAEQAATKRAQAIAALAGAEQAPAEAAADTATDSGQAAAAADIADTGAQDSGEASEVSAEPGAVAADSGEEASEQDSGAAAAEPASQPSKSEEAAVEEAVVQAAPPVKTATPSVQYHVVRRGETLDSIARRYGVSVDNLMGWNDIPNANRILVGQRLEIRKGMPAASLRLTYTVRRGDTLSEIAEPFDVSVGRLKSWNRISRASALQAGQVLSIFVLASQWQQYTVRKGDNLGAIARQHGCSVSELKAWNDLVSDRIHPGQALWLRR